MKKILSLLLSAIMIASALVSCAPAADQLDPAITVASSDAEKYAEWLDGRLDVIPDHVIIGVGSNEKYGVDMSNFDSEGYILRAENGTAVLFGATADGLDRAVREYAQAADNGATDTLNTVYGEGARIEKLTIAGTDISEFTVVAEREEKRATPEIGPTFDNARVAAEDFVRLVKIATGVTLPIVDKGAESGEHFIRFEFLPVAESGSEQSFTYEVKDGDLIIKGEPRTAGCTNAVNYFFEYELGWDGLTWGDSYLAEADEIDITEGTAAAVDPMFDYFYLYNMYQNPYQSDRSYAYRGKIAQAWHGLDAGGYGFDDSLIWPESGICYTGEDTYDLYYNGFKTVVEKKKAGGAKIGYDWFYQDIAHPDGDHYCLCKTCKNLYRNEGSAFSALSVNFANKVAAQMEEEGFGGLKWLVFAYAGSNKPCKTAPRDDVWVTLCTDGACVNHPLTGEDCTGDTLVEQQLLYSPEGGVYAITDRTNNSHFADWIRGWCDLSDNFYVWHYALPTTTYNYTMFDFIYEEWTFLKECGVDGIFWEAEYYALGLTRIRFQLVSWLQWHPDATEEEYNAARDQIMRREYGEGADLVLDMIGLWRESESTVGCFHCWMFTEHFRLGTYDTEIYSKNANQMYELLDIARKKASCYQQDKNIALLQLEVAYRQCMTTYFKAEAGGQTRTLKLLEQRYEQFKSLAAYCGLDIKSFGCALYMGPTSLSDTIYEAAEREWEGYRDELTPEVVQEQYDHVVIIGVDGAGTAWNKKDAPFVMDLFSDGFSTVKCRAANPTISAYNWTSLMTGVNPQVHGVTNETTAPYTLEDYPSIFRLLYEADPEAEMASFVNWININDSSIENDVGVIKGTGSDDYGVLQNTLSYLESNTPDLLFVAFDEVDAAGHSYGGNSSRYKEALYQSDDYISQIYAAFEEKGIIDDTLFIVAADHGHTPGGGHGGQTDAEKFITFFAKGKTISNNSRNINMNIRDIPAIVAHALCIDGNDGKWDSYVPEGLFTDLPEGEPRVNNSTAGHESVETPAGEKALENYVDVSKLESAFFFDGDLTAEYGDISLTAKEEEVVYRDGYYGNAIDITDEQYLSFDGVEFGTDSFSIGLWVKDEVTYTGVEQTGLFGNKVESDKAGQGFLFKYSYDSELNVGNGSDSYSKRLGLPDNFDKKNWYHVLLVVDREENEFSIYYNFKYNSTHSLEGLEGVSFDSGLPFVLGADASGGFAIDAQVDDFLLFNDALTDQEIFSLRGYYFN